MEALSLKWISTVCEAEQLQGAQDTSIRSVCTDTRQLRPGDLFFGLRGERFDGHAYMREAAEKGAAALVIDRLKAGPGLPPCAILAVANPRIALGKLAAAYRKQLDLPIVAVAGSNGKTTTKELLASVLRQRLKLVSSEASYNNDIGVPLTLLRLDRTHQVAVLEAGTNHPGELAPLLEMIGPQHGVLTGLGREHLEFFGDMAGVVEEEGRIAEMLPSTGMLFLNGDMPWAGRIAARARPAAVIRVGLESKNDWRATDIRIEREGTVFRVESVRGEYNGEYRLRLLGKHQALNALFALAVGAEFKVDRAAAGRGLSECPVPRMRLELLEHNGVRILNDAYNANTDSVLAALETMAALPCAGRRVAVLGDMAEMGPHTAAGHDEVGRRAAELGIGQLFAVGKMASTTARAARAAGLTRILEFADVDSAAAAVKSFVKSGDLLLLKASRACRLERIAEALKMDKCFTT